MRFDPSDEIELISDSAVSSLNRFEILSRFIRFEIHLVCKSSDLRFIGCEIQLI